MRKALYAGALLWWQAAGAGAQYSAYLPPEGTLLLTPSYTFQTHGNFWAGTTKVANPTVEQHSGLLVLDYGLTESWAADVAFGYTTSSTSTPAGALTRDGLADTRFGLRYRVFDAEDSWLSFLPTVTLRAGGIVEGTYDTSSSVVFPHLPGKGASGGEIGLLLGKRWEESSFGIYADVGYRVRSERVPDELLASVGMYREFFDALALSVGWRYSGGMSGVDFGAPGFTPNHLVEVKEEAHRIELTLSHADKGGRLYQIYFSHTLAGRNTGEKAMIGAAVTLPLKL
ncbi:MAG: hypothetical protein AB1705_18125 [Verrucomicrobiota bacterium]